MRTAYHKPSFSRAMLWLACALFAGSASAASVEVKVSGVAGGKGKINAAVCDKEHFLKDCTYSGSAPAQAGQTTVTIDNVPKGTWAVLVYQDENQNNKLDRNFIGVPKENYAFSRDARGKFGPPDFTDAAIEIGDDKVVVPVTLK
ncbi:hypothetical protein ASF04_03515 [Duganella sp. Leaf61]|uniref:DUF2141 domain-containing protein n=1 Tax=Duganella sp. Leaf61 TaxID=1736227 RepID=UPI0006FEBF97|nr:DUF2141 domain-containing protein [Duganella sp. Leaf61]KQN79558.1 hypothetical protein ASF04_03515 [Duganella sp. Leaf61]